ncbi:hypothetical protein FRB99_007950 [Tulasnella sp. 403]|nr:hypothetical protein FRB99_007950 [Tulasnella sp. 403]
MRFTPLFFALVASSVALAAPLSTSDEARPSFGDVMDTNGRYVKGLAKVPINAVEEAGDAVVDAFVDAAGFVGTAAKQVYGGVKDGAVTMYRGTKGLVEGAGRTVQGGAHDALSTVGKGVVKAGKWTEDLIPAPASN